MSAVVFIVRIEGIGDELGQHAFTSTTYKTFDPRYRAWLPDGELPSISGQSVQPLGGVLAQGELRFALVDVDDAITTAFSVEADPLTIVSSDASSSATSIAFRSSGSWAYPGAVVAIGRECVRLDALTSGSTWTVTREWLGTTASAITAGSIVWPRLRYLVGREVTLSVAVDDGAEVSFGSWWLDPPELSEDLNVWRISCRSRDRVLDGRPYPSPLRDAVAKTSRRILYPRTGWQWAARYGGRVFVKIQDSICRARIEGQGLDIEETGLSGTPSLESSDKTLDESLVDVRDLEEVFVADPSQIYSSFRYSLSSSDTSTWTRSSHPIPILLALLTSGHPDGAANGRFALGYFACLPMGLGLGAYEIDADAVHLAWVRSQRVDCPYFVLDGESGSMRSIADAIARFAGYTIGWRRGLLVIDYNGSSTADETITLSDLATKERDGHLVPDIGAPRYSTEWLANRVIMRCRGAGGLEVTSEFSRSNFEAIFGAQTGVYGDDYTLDIEAPWVRVDSVGAEPEFVRQRALFILRSLSNPLWTATVALDLSWWLEQRIVPGEIVKWTHPQMPDLAAGVRGGDKQVEWRVLDEAPDFQAGLCRYRLLALVRPTAVGRIAPSARIASSTGAAVTVEANRYTDPSNQEGWPATDAAAFTELDLVRLVGRDGTPISTSPTYGMIVSIAGNVITLDTSFGGSALTAGRLIEYVASSVAIPRQYQKAIYIGGATEEIGATGVRAWRIRNE
jgi:hypothetical protein